MRYFFARGNGSDMKTQSRRPTHMALLIASVAVVLFSTAGIAAIKGWRPVSSDVRALQEAPAMSAQEVALTAQKAQRRAKAKARANGRCAECGVIESMREIDRYDGDFGNDAAGALTGVERNEKPLSLKKRYEIIVRMADGSSRTLTSASPSNFRFDERVIIIAGTIPPSR